MGESMLEPRFASEDQRWTLLLASVSCRHAVGDPCDACVAAARRRVAEAASA